MCNRISQLYCIPTYSDSVGVMTEGNLSSSNGRKERGEIQEAVILRDGGDSFSSSFRYARHDKIVSCVKVAFNVIYSEL